MIKKMTCIECPRGCSLSVDIEGCRLVRVEGNQCPKGEAYAKAEVENPARVMTGTVLSKGLSLKMIPVRTAGPIPKEKIPAAAAELKRIRVASPLRAGEVIMRDFMGLGTDLITTREVNP